MDITGWRTSPASGRAHLFANSLTVCGSPTDITRRAWQRTKPAHAKCVDCLAFERGASALLGKGAAQTC